MRNKSLSDKSKQGKYPVDKGLEGILLFLNLRNIMTEFKIPLNKWIEINLKNQYFLLIHYGLG